MPYQLESDRARPEEARDAIIFFILIACLVVGFLLFGRGHNDTNTESAPPPGERDLKVGVEGATSNPQAVTPTK